MDCGGNAFFATIIDMHRKSNSRRGRMYTKRVACAALVASSLFLAACEETTPPATMTQNVEDSRSVVDKVNKARKIEAKKDFFSWSDHWRIYADGDEVGEIKGLVFPVTGDVYALYSKKGNLVGSEVEDKGWVSSEAAIYDWHTQEIGHLEKEPFSFMMRIDIYRGKDGKHVGSNEENLNFFTINSDIKNVDGSAAWKMRKSFSSYADLEITRQDGADHKEAVKGMEALWVSLVMNELSEDNREG